MNPLDPPAQKPAPLLPTLLGPVANAVICGVEVHAANKPRSAEELAQAKRRRTSWNKMNQKLHINIFGYDEHVPSDYVDSDDEVKDDRGGYSHTDFERLVCKETRWFVQTLHETTAPPAWTPPPAGGDSGVACGDDGLIWQFSAAEKEWTRHEDNIYPGALAWTRWWPSLQTALPAGMHGNPPHRDVGGRGLLDGGVGGGQ